MYAVILLPVIIPCLILAVEKMHSVRLLQIGRFYDVFIIS